MWGGERGGIGGEVESGKEEIKECGERTVEGRGRGEA